MNCELSFRTKADGSVWWSAAGQDVGFFVPGSPVMHAEQLHRAQAEAVAQGLCLSSPSVSPLPPVPVAQAAVPPNVSMVAGPTSLMFVVMACSLGLIAIGHQFWEHYRWLFVWPSWLRWGTAGVPVAGAVPLPTAPSLSLQPVVGHHVLVAAQTGAGKTTLLKALAADLTGDICILDPKNSASWGSLKRFTRYLPPTHTDEVLAVFQAVRQELHRRIEGAQVKAAPLTLIVDEWLSYRLCLQRQTTTWKEAKALLEELIALGREYGVSVVLVGQSPLVSDIGLSGGLRDNLAYVCLSSPGRESSIKSAINSQHLFPDTTERKALQAQFAELSATGARVVLINGAMAIPPDWSVQEFDYSRLRRWGIVETVDCQAIPLPSSDAEFPLSNVVPIPRSPEHRSWDQEKECAELILAGVSLTDAIKSAWGRSGGSAYQRNRAKLLVYLGQLPPESQRPIFERCPSLQGAMAECGEPRLKAG
jgi:energy-coupling factor transporter ATP-binding protein EcfA2